MRVRYVGAHASVEIAATGQVAERGADIEVSDDLGESLCEQDSWSRVRSASKKKKGTDNVAAPDNQEEE